MVEVGIIGASDRVELIGGDVIDMAPVGSAHAGKVNRFAAAFAPAVRDGPFILSVQNPLHLDDHNEPQPDLLLLRPREDFYESASDGRRRAAPREDRRHVPRL